MPMGILRGSYCVSQYFPTFRSLRFDPTGKSGWTRCGFGVLGLAYSTYHSISDSHHFRTSIIFFSSNNLSHYLSRPKSNSTSSRDSPEAEFPDSETEGCRNFQWSRAQCILIHPYALLEILDN